MKIIKALALAAPLILTPLAQASEESCPPQPPWTQPMIPNGASATEADMRRAQAEVASYISEIEHWNDCDPEVHGLLSGRMVSKAKAVAEEYNTQLQEFLIQQHNASAIAVVPATDSTHEP